jgi:signal transduction histidine kinase
MKELVEGFAHEVKNPLASIRGALKILMKKSDPEDPNSKVMDQVLEQVGKINRALSDLVNFTKLAAPESSLTDINHALEKSLGGIRSECKRNKIGVEQHLSSNLPKIKIDTRQTETAFLYILVDMVHAMPDGGKLVTRSSMDRSGQALIEFEDTGSAIPEIHMERLFKPFLSTRGRGHGIGLSMAKRVIIQNGGSIEVQNRGEEGMRFRITFSS